MDWTHTCVSTVRPRAVRAIPTFAASHPVMSSGSTISVGFQRLIGADSRRTVAHCRSTSHIREPAALRSVPQASAVDDLAAGRPARRLHRAARHGLLPSIPQAIQRLSMPHRRGTVTFICIWSRTATGETLITVARAAAAQYANVSPVEHIYPLVRTQKQLDRVLTEIEECAGHRALHAARGRPDRAAGGEMPRARPAVPVDPRTGAAAVPVLSRRRDQPRVGAQHTLNAEYFKRIDALNYTMLHDDGQHTDDLEEADVVLVGVSRTSKTPTSIYLANRGVKTANVPLVPGVPVPPQLETLTQPLVVGLYRQPRADRADPAEPPARPAARSTTTTNISTARRWPRRSRSRASSAASTTGRSST